jgi:hypothetical protein
MSERGISSGVVAPVLGRIRGKPNRYDAAADGGYYSMPSIGCWMLGVERWTFFP